MHATSPVGAAQSGPGSQPLRPPAAAEPQNSISPGTWRVKPVGVVYHLPGIFAGDRRIALIETTPRDADLIAAAPDLLHALKELLAFTEPPTANCSCHIQPPCGDCEKWAGLREAWGYAHLMVAKAEGRP